MNYTNNPSWSFQYRHPQTEDGWRTSTKDWPDAEHAAAAVAQMQAICAICGVIIEARLYEVGTQSPSSGSYEPPVLPETYTRIDAGTGREKPLTDDDWPQN